MTEPPAAPRPRLVRATLIAALAAAVILIVAVLPAEYGIDPSGLGRKFGLTALSGVDPEPVPATSPLTSTGAQTTSTAPRGSLKFDTYEVELRPFEGVEYKYRLEKGDAIVYEWSATEAVNFEFHGEPDGAPPKYFDSYVKGEGRTGSGGFTAAKSGIHGWFWENKGENRIKVTLHSSGFYSASTEYRDGEKIQRRFDARDTGPAVSGSR